MRDALPLGIDLDSYVNLGQICGAKLWTKCCYCLLSEVVYNVKIYMRPANYLVNFESQTGSEPQRSTSMHYNQTLDLLHGLLEFEEFKGAQTERAQVTFIEQSN